MGAETLEHIVAPKPDPRAKAQTWVPDAVLVEFHTPEPGIGQVRDSWSLQPRAPSPTREHADDPVLGSTGSTF